MAIRTRLTSTGLAALGVTALLACQQAELPLDQSCSGVVETMGGWPSGPVLAATLRTAPLKAAVQYCYVFDALPSAFCGGRRFEAPGTITLVGPGGHVIPGQTRLASPGEVEFQPGRAAGPRRDLHGDLGRRSQRVPPRRGLLLELHAIAAAGGRSGLRSTREPPW